MKTQIILRISGCLLSILITGSSFAQIVSSSYKQTDYEKLSPVTVTSPDFKTIEHIKTEFNKQFTGATDDRWYDLDKKFLVRFYMNDQKHQSLFNKKGLLIYDISFGTEKNLPTDVRKQVKSIYFDYSITLVFKVEEDKRTIWVVNMEDNKTLITVRVEDGEMEEVKNLQKS
jgi:hypothetical protein